MGRGRRQSVRRRCSIRNHAGAPARQPGKAHRQPGQGGRLYPGAGKRLVQTAFKAPPAAVEARQTAIGMAQGAQRRRDAFNRSQMCSARSAPGFGQGQRRPGQQREHLEQLFRIACRDAAFRVDFRCAFAVQRGPRARHVPFHPGQGQSSVDKPGQRLEPGQARCRRLPAAGQKDGLARQGAVIGVGRGPVLAVQQEQGVVDPADDPPARQIRGPAGAGATTESRDPAPGPILRLFPGGTVADCRQIIQPGKALHFIFEGRIGNCDIPDRQAGGLDQMPGEQEVARNKLSAPRIKPDAARLWLRHESCRRRCQPGPAGMQPVQRLRPSRRKARSFRHARLTSAWVGFARNRVLRLTLPAASGPVTDLPACAAAR